LSTTKIQFAKSNVNIPRLHTPTSYSLCELDRSTKHYQLIKAKA